MSKKHRRQVSLVQHEKANPNYQTVIMNGPNALPVMMPRNMKAYLHEGYRNKTAFRVVGQIARSGAGIKWKHYTDQTKQREIANSDLLKLWNRPNAEQGGTKFRENMLAYYCLTGNSYVLGINATQNPRAKFDELYCLRPDLTKVHISDQSVVDYYEFGQAYPYKHYDKATVMHSRLFAGDDDVYGLSPIEVAAMLVDIQKASQKWNLSLMSNMAAPSGAWVTKQILNDPDYRNLKREIHEKFSGPRNAREPVILHGGVEWQSMSMTPMELDFLSSDEKTDRDIAGIFFNFPVYLLGLADTTFNNQSEAKHYLYTDICFPILDAFVDDLNSWLTPRYGGWLDYDREDVETIQERIQAAKAQASDRAMAEWQAGTTTFHEAREIQGKEKLPTKDFIMLNGAPVFVDQLDEYIQAQVNKVINPPPPPPQLLPHTTVMEEDQQPEPDTEDEQDDEEQNPQKRLALPAPLIKLPSYQGPVVDVSRVPRTTKALDLRTAEQKEAYFNSMETLREKWETVVEERIADYFKDEQKTVLAALQRDSDDIESVEDRVMHALDVVEQQGTLKQILVKVYQDVGTDVGDQVLQELKSQGGAHEKKDVLSYINLFGPDVLIYLLQLAAWKVSKISEHSKALIQSELANGVAEGESVEKLAKRLDDLYIFQTHERSRLIAATEVVAASNYGSQEAAKQSGLTLKKVWLATDDSHTRPDHRKADGQEVDLDEPFDVGGYQLMFPGDTSLGAPGKETVACRCTQYYKRIRGVRSETDEEPIKSLALYFQSLPESNITREQYREFLKADAKHGHHDQRTHGNRYHTGPHGKPVLSHAGGGKPGHNVGDRELEKPAHGTIHVGANGKPKEPSGAKPSASTEKPKETTDTTEQGEFNDALKKKSIAQKEKYIAENGGDEWTKSLTSSEKKAIEEYTDSGYRTMNKKLREGGKETKQIKDLQTALMKSKAPADMTVTRGYGDGPHLEAFKAAAKNGGVFEEKGFVSTTIQDKATFQGFTVNIKVRKGAPGAYVAPVSSFSPEREFILPHGSKFKVLKGKQDRRGQWTFDVEYSGSDYKTLGMFWSLKQDDKEDNQSKGEKMSDKFTSTEKDDIVWLDTGEDDNEE